jgi:hypothetical protein
MTVAAVLLTALIVSACSAPVEKPDQTGFLSDYSRLELIDNDNLRYVGPRADEYERFIIDSVTILFQPDPENPVFSEKELKHLKEYVVRELTEQLTKGDDGYEVVTAPGPGVARIRIGLTEVDDTIGLLNVSIYTKISGLGLGGASVEGEVVDSVSGEQLAAAVRWGSGSRVLRAGYTHTGDAKIQISKWAHQLRKQLDELHGR